MRAVVVHAVALAAEGGSLCIAWRHFRSDAGSRSAWQAFRDSKDPRIFVPLAEDVAALLGVVVAAAGVFLAGVAVLLAVESRSLLLGERADAGVLRRVRDVVRRQPGADLADVVTLHIGPEQIALTLTITMAGDQALTRR